MKDFYSKNYLSLKELKTLENCKILDWEIQHDENGYGTKSDQQMQSNPNQNSVTCLRKLETKY